MIHIHWDLAPEDIVASVCIVAWALREYLPDMLGILGYWIYEAHLVHRFVDSILSAQYNNATLYAVGFVVLLYLGHDDNKRMRRKAKKLVGNKAKAIQEKMQTRLRELVPQPT